MTEFARSNLARCFGALKIKSFAQMVVSAWHCYAPLPIRKFHNAFLFGALLFLMVALFSGRSASAHPHVFVDGGVNFVIDDQGSLTALEVTWRYDLFETLYVLSKLGISPNSDGSLSDFDHTQLVANETAWPKGFDGAAHLSVAGTPIALSGPKSMQARLDQDRLSLTFVRDLDTSVALIGQHAEVAFYESTYYYAFSVTDKPRSSRTDEACSIEVLPFATSEQLSTLQVTLAALGREETPDTENVGALFADKIVLDCR